MKEIMKMRNITVKELASTLDVSTSQIYKWNREGISRHNPHFYKLKEILPEVQPKEPLLTKQGEEDQRYRAGRKRIKSTLSITDSETKEKEFESALFPKIHIDKK